jgi:hypothetical protein
MASVVLASPLSQYTNNQSHLEIPGQTLFKIFINLIQDFPELRMQLFDVQGELIDSIHFYLNKNTVTKKHWQNIPVKNQDVISLKISQ